MKGSIFTAGCFLAESKKSAGLMLCCLCTSVGSVSSSRKWLLSCCCLQLTCRVSLVVFRNTVGKNVKSSENSLRRAGEEPALFPNVLCLFFCWGCVYLWYRYQMASFCILLIIGTSGWFSVLYLCSSSSFSLPLLILLLFYLCSTVEFE